MTRPRYHARDVAVLMGQKLGAKVLLASATPSMTSYHKYDVVKLGKPYVEAKKKYHFITGDSINRPILTMLHKNFRSKEQSLLFLPTRGNFKYLYCESCGKTHLCPYCSVGMALHRKYRHLKCHYCNYTEAIRDTCIECGHTPLKSERMGTVEAIEIISDTVEGIQIEQFDRDSITTAKKLKEASKLSSHDFYLPFHQYIFAAMEELSREEKPIDEEFLRSKLVSMGKFDEVAMLDLLSANPISNTAAYLTEIKAKSSKRALATLATEIKKVVIEDDLPAEEVMNLVEKKLYEITQNNTNEDFRDSKDITLKMMDEINRLKALGNSKLIGVDTGFKNLNDKTSGFGKGDLVIIAARPAMGKTALVLNMALKAIERNEGVAFFSLEMPAEQLMLRLLSAKTSIPLQALRVGDLRDEQWSQLSAATDELSQKKLFVDDGGYATIHHVRSKLRKLKTQHPEISIAIIDYLQLMSGDGKEGRQQEVSEISRGLKQLARELQIPIVALSQLNRGVESRDNKRPMLSDLRESGAIEQDADIILFVYRDDVYREAMEKEKEMKAKAEGKPYESEFRKKSEEDAEIIIGKQRNGPTGTVDLVFQKNFTRFVDKVAGPAFEITYEDADIPMNTGNINVDMPPI